VEPAEVARFVREAQITAQLEHPNVPAVHALGIDAAGRPFFAMTRLGGQSLAHLLAAAHAERAPATGRRCPSTACAGSLAASNARLLRIFLQIGSAVAFAHSRGVLHRDLKPENVIIGDFGEVRLMDWGLAKLIGGGPGVDEAAAGARDPVAERGAILGTPGYAAPEQLTPGAEVDARSDVYALGALLYAMLAGRPPIVGPTLEQSIEDTRAGRVPPLRSLVPVSDRTAAIVHKALDVTPDRRYRDVAAMLADVEALLEGRRVAALEEGVLRTVGRFYLDRTERMSRLRYLEIDLWCWGSLAFGILSGAYWCAGMPDWVAGLLLVSAVLAFVPGLYTVLRAPRPDDPGVVMAFTEGLTPRSPAATPAALAPDPATAPTITPADAARRDESSHGSGG
jgi:serine/threonine protein kinase